LEATTALGITETANGFSEARRVVFSLLDVRCQHDSFYGAFHYLMASLPSMRHTNHVPDITQAELQQLIRHDTRSITETEQAVIGEDSPQTHRPSVQ